MATGWIAVRRAQARRGLWYAFVATMFVGWLGASAALAQDTPFVPDEWKFGRWVLYDYFLGAINCVCWFGQTIAELPDPGIVFPEEPQVGRDWPRLLGRPNEICGEALVAHFAYFPQREALDRTNLLERYRGLIPGFPRPGSEPKMA